MYTLEPFRSYSVVLTAIDKNTHIGVIVTIKAVRFLVIRVRFLPLVSGPFLCPRLCIAFDQHKDDIKAAFQVAFSVFLLLSEIK